MTLRKLSCALVLLAGACTSVPPPVLHPAMPSYEPGAGCTTAQVTIAFDFEGASGSACSINGAREFSILVTPEHAPPINPSPWYAFRYSALGDAPVAVHLRYLGAQHRYTPKLTMAGETTELATDISADGKTVTIALPPGEARVTAQPLWGLDRYARLAARLAALPTASHLVLGASHDGRPIEAVRIGNSTAPHLIVLLGRQHPPEITGAYAMEPFVETLGQAIANDPALASRFQIIAVPLLNPDGVALGHWRANHGGTDLNRDWGKFTQPETRAVGDWLAGLPAHIRPVAMIDFHSTRRNLFYVQGEEATEAQERFLSAWLAGKENLFPGYAFTLERSNANPGSGTSKNWFHAAYAIPAYTYEVADDADESAARAAAAQLAADLIDVLARQIPR